MQYDASWNYLGSKTLATDGQWPQGTVWDEQRQRFYVAYLNTAVQGATNVALGVFDPNWDPIETIAVTDFQAGDFTESGRPSVTLHDKRLYVSFDVSTHDPQTHDSNFDWQALVNIYEVVY